MADISVMSQLCSHPDPSGVPELHRIGKGLRVRGPSTGQGISPSVEEYSRTIHPSPCGRSKGICSGFIYTTRSATLLKVGEGSTNSEQRICNKGNRHLLRKVGMCSPGRQPPRP